MSQKVRLGDYISIKGGGTPNKAIKGYWNGNIPWMSVKDLKSTVVKTTINTITPSGLANSAANLIKKGSLILATRMAVGKVVYAGMDTAINQDLKAITVSPALYHKYLFYQLNSKQDYFERNSKGATVKGIKLDVLRDLEIPLPPLEEQKKIAAILDAADEYRQKTKALIDKYDQLTRSLFLDMFGELLQTRSNIITLEELCGKGKYGSGASAIQLDESLPRYVRITDINDSGDLNDKKMSPSELDEQYILRKNDLLFARTGATVGKTYLYKESDGELIYAGYLIKFNIPKPHNALYFFHFTKTNYYKSWVDNQQNVVAQPNINAKQYGNELEIPLPPIKLQNLFAERVAQIEKQKQQAEASLVKAEELFSSLLQRAFKGELTN